MDASGAWRRYRGTGLPVMVAVLAVSAAVQSPGRGGWVIADTNESSSLEVAFGYGATVSMRPGQRGVAWGIQTLSNRDPDDDLTLLAVRVRRDGDDTRGDLAVRGDPYLFDDGRWRIMDGNGGFDVQPVPLPEPVDLVPRHAVHGYVLPPAAPDGDTPDAELVIEFDAPSRVSSIAGIEIDYEVGGRRHVLAVDAPVVVCPAGQEQECRSEG